MNEKDPLQNNIDENEEKAAPEILTNEYDPAVVVDDDKRTVLLTENETLVIDKDPEFDIVPKNRPRKVYGGMWGPVEIAAVGAGAFVLLALLLFYVFVVARSNRDLEDKKAQRDTLESELKSAKERYGNITDTKKRVSELLASVDDFEVRFLPVTSIGQTALYQRINGLIASNNLINSTGPNYLALDVIDPRRRESEEEKGKSKFKSLFPGVYVSMTVEGTYQNLRRFIREMESTEQFLVISTVELEPTDAEKKDKEKTDQAGKPADVNNPNFSPNFGGPNFGGGAAPQLNAAEQKGKMHGETVSLRIEMAAYFRRPNFVPQAPPENGEQ